MLFHNLVPPFGIRNFVRYNIWYALACSGGNDTTYSGVRNLEIVSTIGNRVYPIKVSGVRIPDSPPSQNPLTATVCGFFAIGGAQDYLPQNLGNLVPCFLYTITLNHIVLCLETATNRVYHIKLIYVY